MPQLIVTTKCCVCGGAFNPTALAWSEGWPPRGGKTLAAGWYCVRCYAAASKGLTVHPGEHVPGFVALSSAQVYIDAFYAELTRGARHVH